MIKGYKVYFNGTRFISEGTKSDVKDTYDDSTTLWLSDKWTADKVAERYNNPKNISDIRKCKCCGQFFWLTAKDRAWFIEKGLKTPVRCKKCRVESKSKGALGNECNRKSIGRSR